MSKSWPSAIIALLLVLTVPDLRAYRLSGDKWPNPTTVFHVDIPGADGLWNDAFETAMVRWDQQTIFNYTIVRNSFKDPCDPPDNPRNGVKFDDTVCGEAWGSTALAITRTWSQGTTTVQSGIVFNSNEKWDVYDGPWRGSPGDFRRVAVHELGHSLGLRHEDGVVAIMSTSVGPGDTIVVPQPDDIAGVNALYGSTPPGPSAQPISVGQTVSGTLTSSDARTPAGDGSFADNYQLTLTTAQTVTIEMSSSAFDTFLVVVDSAETLVGIDDDGGSGTNSRLEIPLQAGTFIIEATSLTPGDGGPYTLSVSGIVGPAPTPISLAQTVNGLLEASDARTRAGDGSFADNYQLTLTTAQTVTIEMSSSAFDTFLVVVDSAETLVGIDDDGGSGTNSRLEIPLQAGTFIIEATSLTPGDGGPYTLSVSGIVGPAPPPTLPANSVVNVASFRSASDPNGAIAPGAIVAIFGTDLASDTVLAQEVPLPTTLGDTSVTFNDIPAPLFFVSGTQINAQVPFELMTGVGSVTVQVKRGSETSTAQPTGIAAVSPGIFTLNQQGTGAGAVLHAVDFQPVNDSSPARAGEFLLIFCTGLGPVQPEVASGDVAPTAEPLARTISPPMVNIAGIAADVTFSGLAPGFVGLYQVNLQVPAGVPSGTQEVEIIINGVPSNTVTIAVQ